MYYLHPTQRLTGSIRIQRCGTWEVSLKWSHFQFTRPFHHACSPSKASSRVAFLSIIASHFSRDLPGRKPSTSDCNYENGNSVGHNREESWSQTHHSGGRGRSGPVDLFLMLVSETCSQHWTSITTRNHV